MIICSCTVITDHDIETALIEILNEPDALMPTPGVVFRHLQKKMKCCGCAPLTIETIYAKMTDLIERGAVCPDKGAQIRGKLLRLVPRRQATASQFITPCRQRLSLAS